MPRLHEIATEVLKVAEGTPRSVLVKFSVASPIDTTDKAFEKELLWALNHPMPAPGRARVFEPGPGRCPGSGGPLSRKAPSPPRPSLPRSARAIGTFGVTPVTFLRKLVKGDAALPDQLPD